MSGNYGLTRTRFLLWLGGLCLLAAGCAGGAAQQARGPRPTAVPYGRLAVVEFHDQSQYSTHGYGAEFSRVLAEKLAAWTASTDIVLMALDDLPQSEDPFVSGQMPLEVLVAARRRHQAGVVVVGSLGAVHPYRPLSVTISLKAVDTSGGQVLAALTDEWNAGDRSVRADVESYYLANQEREECRFGPELFLNSPRYFLRFVADQAAERIASSLSGG